MQILCIPGFKCLVAAAFEVSDLQTTAPECEVVNSPFSEPNLVLVLGIQPEIKFLLFCLQRQLRYPILALCNAPRDTVVGSQQKLVVAFSPADGRVHAIARGGHRMPTPAALQAHTGIAAES